MQYLQPFSLPALQAEADAAGPPATDALLRARELVLRYGWNTMAYQILNPGMRLWLSSDADAVVGYVPSASYRVVAGAPVCAPARLAEVSAAFERDTRRTGRQICYFGAQERFEATLAERRQLARLLLGAQPVWHPQYWDLVLSRKSSLRAQVSRARNKHVRASQWSAEQAANHSELRRLLAEWLATRGLPPLHFLIEPNILDRLYDRMVFVAEREGRALGFLVATPVPLRNGWLIEQIVRGNGAPNGTSELLLDAAMRTLAQTGADYVTLGLSPLSRLAGISQPDQPLGVRLLLAWVRAHGRRFYNFAGLDAYKAKFLPEYWEPIYAISYGRQMSLRALYAVAGAFSGTSPVLFISWALGRAVGQELHTFKRYLGRRLQ